MSRDGLETTFRASYKETEPALNLYRDTRYYPSPTKLISGKIGRNIHLRQPLETSIWLFCVTSKKEGSPLADAKQSASQSVRQAAAGLPFRHIDAFVAGSIAKAGAASRNTTKPSSLGGRVRVSTLAFRTFGLFRTAASQRRDLPPPEELFFLSFPSQRVHPLARQRIRGRPLP